MNSVLIFFDFETFFVGGALRHTSQFRLLQQFFPNAEIHFTSSDSRVVELALNSPELRSLELKQYKEVPYDEYDCVVFLSERETEIANHIVSKYYKLFSRKIDTIMFSISSFSYAEDVKVFFPVLLELVGMKFDQDIRLDCHKNKVHLSKEEIDWANTYLAEKGVKKDDMLVIINDSSALDGKVIKEGEFINLIKLILEKQDTKILIYDVKNVGKRSHFKEYLNEEMLDRILFVAETSLREDISLMAGNNVKAIIGPCTGMMHCASGIYNVSKDKKAPLILVYKGNFEDMGSAYGTNYWWGKNDLVDCVLKMKGVGELIHLSDIEDQDNIIDYEFLYEKDIHLNQKLDDTKLITATDLMDKVTPSLLIEVEHY
ncbi:glycosyltransferase family 9 protein [Tenacibaculum agarivorans]|uniref:glycosyltransferase family 9 protein n=1 Tax=Tenacibaculum agarivorans TaxID=1908389 RepID=UPI0011803D39|nr:hypothetical protein [Tenacibaculum agarivorans]